MKYCSYCKVLNEEDSKVCKICGRKLEDNVKTKYKTKIKKIKPKTKVKYKTKYKNVYRDRKEKGNMSFFQKFTVFILVNLCLALIAACAYMGYYIYSQNNIDVPNVIGYTFEEARSLLKENKLECIKIDKKITDEDREGLVIDQDKKGKAKENQTVKLTVGVLDDYITVPKLTGLKKEDAEKVLDDLGIKWNIIYEEKDSEEIVLKQSIKASSKINKGEFITLTISKKIKKVEISTDEVQDNEGD